MKRINNLLLAIVFSFVAVAPMSAIPLIQFDMEVPDYFDEDEITIKADTITFSDVFNIIFSDISPRIDLSASVGSFSRLSLNPNSKESYTFNEPDVFELKAGYVKEKRSVLRSIVKTSYSYFTFRYMGNENNLLDLPDPLLNIDFHGKQLGFGNESAMGWKICNGFDILLTNADNYHWTHTKFIKDNDAHFGDKRDRFHDKVSYGTSFESGITLNLFNSVGVNASYEQNHLLPAYMTWYFIGSTMIENLAKVFTRSFVNSIAKRSTFAGPIINFLVQSGISYGMYELRKSKMNWPFSNESPLAMERIKIGLSYTFK